MSETSSGERCTSIMPRVRRCGQKHATRGSTRPIVTTPTRPGPITPPALLGERSMTPATRSPLRSTPPAEVVFTSGGSEADNLAVRGVLGERGGIAVCSAGEHHAVLEPVEDAGGMTVGLEADGTVSPDRLAAVLDTADEPVSVVSMIAVNNETGVINDIPALIDVTRRHAPEAVFHTDAVQAVSWVDLSVVAADADLVSITGHKLGGPVGTGALFVRNGVTLDPLILGEVVKSAAGERARLT